MTFIQSLCMTIGAAVLIVICICIISVLAVFVSSFMLHIYTKHTTIESEHIEDDVPNVYDEDDE